MDINRLDLATITFEIVCGSPLSESYSILSGILFEFHLGFRIQSWQMNCSSTFMDEFKSSSRDLRRALWNKTSMGMVIICRLDWFQNQNIVKAGRQLSKTLKSASINERYPYVENYLQKHTGAPEMFPRNSQFIKNTFNTAI